MSPNTADKNGVTNTHQSAPRKVVCDVTSGGAAVAKKMVAAHKIATVKLCHNIQAIITNTIYRASAWFRITVFVFF